MTKFRQVVPTSTNQPEAEAYEHYLVWLSPMGGVRSWFYSSTDGVIENDTSGVIIEGIEDIRNVPTQGREVVEAVTVSLNRDTFDYVASIMKSNRVYRCDKSGTLTPVAVKFGAYEKANRSKEFNFKIVFSYKENSVLNV